MISREAIAGFWENNESNGVAMHAPMLWGYFFTNDEMTLEQAIPTLEGRGYACVGILGRGDGESGYILHVERDQGLAHRASIGRAKVDGKPMAVKDPDHDIRAFWTWFRTVEARLQVSFTQDDLIAALEDRVGRLGELRWELGPGEVAENAFAISPGGDVEMLPLAEPCDRAGTVVGRVGVSCREDGEALAAV
jgi:hypothetical protein